MGHALTALPRFTPAQQVAARYGLAVSPHPAYDAQVVSTLGAHPRHVVTISNWALKFAVDPLKEFATMLAYHYARRCR